MPRHAVRERQHRGARALAFLNLVLTSWSVLFATHASRWAPAFVQGPGSGGHNQKKQRDLWRKPLKPEQFWTHTLWGQLLSHPQVGVQGSSQAREFETEFRVPYDVFVTIVQQHRGRKWTQSTTGKQMRKKGRPCIPLEFKILMCLYRLGGGSITRVTARVFSFSPSLADKFFKDFCAEFAQEYHHVCKPPETDAEIKAVESVYAKMGLPGCVGDNFL